MERTINVLEEVCVLRHHTEIEKAYNNLIMHEKFMRKYLQH
jgi:hypothetical protein